MKYRTIHEEHWKGTFYATVECSNCGQQLRDTQRKHAPVYCPHCGHNLYQLPIRLSADRIVAALNVTIPYNPV
jgi:DNA-directed RNA polymerase subunit RPC12/RpoP